jgi:probable rRNA maturation factor
VDPDSSRLRVTLTDGRGRPVRDGGLGRWLTSVVPARVRGEVAIALAPDSQVRALNHRYRRKNVPTDVLSFPSNEKGFLGDVVIATGVARRQAIEMGHPLRTELRVLALHGLLHLLGFDHEDRRDKGTMARVETRLRRKGGLSAGLIDRAGRRPRPRVRHSGGQA